LDFCEARIEDHRDRATELLQAVHNGEIVACLQTRLLGLATCLRKQSEIVSPLYRVQCDDGFMMTLTSQPPLEWIGDVHR
jgi:hypothetical protein